MDQVVAGPTRLFLRELSEASKPLTVKELTQATGLNSTKICQLAVILMQSGRIRRQVVGEFGRFAYSLPASAGEPDAALAADVTSPAKPVSAAPKPPRAAQRGVAAGASKPEMPAMVRKCLLSAVESSESALLIYLESRSDPVLSALVASTQMSWRAAAIAGVLP